MNYRMTQHYGNQWIITEDGGEVLCRPFSLDETTVLWRAMARKHISDVRIHGINKDGDTVHRTLFDAHADYSELRDLSFTFSSNRDRVTLAGFLWVVSDPAYRFNFDSNPLPKAKRPTSKKAVKNDWEYTTPIAASA